MLRALLALAWLSSLILACSVEQSKAAEIQVEYSDLGTYLYPSMVVHVSGEIVTGDADRISTEITKNSAPKQRGIFFSFDSPGGNLLEGVKIGRLIASRPELTTSLVGNTENPDAICASACVFAFLGAETREKHPDARIGLHQFYLGNNMMDGDEALGVGQLLSAIVTSYLAERKASAEIFSRMVLTEPGDIDWVSDPDLAELRIVGGNIIHASSEFINNGGQVALQMSLEMREGAHTLVVGCNNPGVYMVASIASHDDQGEITDAALILDEKRADPAHVEFISFKDRKVVLLFVMSQELVAQVTRSRLIGAYYFSEDQKHWFGNMQEIDQTKFSDLVASCR